VDSYFVTLTMAPGSKKGAAENFFFLWDHGVRNINFLPVYYKKWSSSDLRALKKDLFDIASFLKPYIINNQCRVRNVEKKGMIPLFGHAICLDTDGRYYYTNAILLKKLKAVKQELEIARSLDRLEESLPAFLDGRKAANVIQGSYHSSVLRSNRRVDAALSAFVRKLEKKPAPAPSRPRARKQGSRPERLELHLSYRCTNDCLFCSERHRLELFRGRDVSAGDAWRVLQRHRSAGGSHVNFTGGEPTLHPSFISLCEGARNLGMRVYVGTNGVMLGREEFAARAAGLIDELSLSIHGPEARVHEAGTRKKGSFTDILRTAALARRLNPDQMLMANMVVTRINFRHVAATLRLCADLGVSQVLLSNPSPEGRALDHYEELVVPLKHWKRAVGSMVDKAEELGLALRFFGLPACALGEWKTRSNDFFFDPRITVEQSRRRGGRTALNTIITRHPRRGRKKVRACRLCRYNDLCGGIFGDYVKIYKEKEINPIEG
jgi:MoaA/NifB/PqqE/SkfB family radical SAM enzyme